MAAFAAESALEVLSRAASIVTAENFQDKKEKSLKQLPTKLRRESRKKRSRQLQVPVTSTTSEKTPPQTTSSECDSPIDMRLSPSRPSVITWAPTTGINNKTHSKIGPCDPVIDEHFRRSLGKEYANLFESESCTPVSEGGLSVDDHFAKALGDTWLQLNKTHKKEKRIVLT